MKQIEILANYIMNEVDGEPSRSEGAGDCAIRIIRKLKSENKRLRNGMEYWRERAGPISDMPDDSHRSSEETRVNAT